MEEPLIGRIKHLAVTFRPALGSGAFGTVYKCENTITKDVCAAKEIKLGDRVARNPKLVQMAEQELDVIMKLQSHNNIVKVVEYFTHGNSFWIVMEFCNEGDLKMYLSKHEHMSRFEQAQILSQSASAVAFMHAQSPPIVHRDIKLQNILIKAESGQVILKICDFGFAKFYENPGSSSYSAIFKQGPMMDSMKGTTPFMAPEFSAELEGGLQYDSSVDVFALGLVFRVVLEPSNPDFYPLSVEAQKANRYISIGYEMIHCYREQIPMPTVIEIHDEDDRVMKRMKRIVKHMTRFKASRRKDIEEVDDELKEILTALEEDGRNISEEGTVAATFTQSTNTQLKRSMPPLDSNNFKVSEQPVPSSFLTFLIGKTWTRQQKRNLPYYPTACRIINGQIWQCVLSNKIIIYSDDLLEQRRIEGKRIYDETELYEIEDKRIYDVGELPNGDVVVATRRDLLHITAQGDTLQCLSYGNFRSVVVHKNTVFAFNASEPEIQKHRFNDNSWQSQKEIEHQNSPRMSFVTLCVDDSTIYTCYPNTKIDSFSYDGEHKGTYGKKGHGEAGELDYSIICALDKLGFILVADCDNHRLQLLDTKSNQWHIVDVQPQPVRPRHALLHNGRLYIASFDEATLSVYTAT